MSILKFISTQLTIRALRKSMVLLSNSKTVHYKETTYQIAQTRFALLKLMGMAQYNEPDIDALSYEAKLEQIGQLNQEIAQQISKREALDVLIKRKMMFIEDLNSQIEAAQEKLAELNKASEATNTETDNAENTEK